MTKRQKQNKIYRACELTELRRRHFSCVTIGNTFNLSTRRKYQHFIGGFYPWLPVMEFMNFEQVAESYRSIRIMAMLLFLETEPESLNE